MSINLDYYQPADQDQLTQRFYKTPIPGLYYFETPLFSDDRGFFSEVCKTPEIEEVAGQKFEIKQFNHARSEQDVVRGLHAEGWNKLVTVTQGKICSVIVDIRPESKTFKQAAYFQLGPDHEAEVNNGLYISQGLANSVCVLKGPVDYLYLVDKLYEERTKADEKAINLFDPELNITWPITKEAMILSKRDQQAISLREALKLQ